MFHLKWIKYSTVIGIISFNLKGAFITQKGTGVPTDANH
jgi:hypothetical protein